VKIQPRVSTIRPELIELYRGVAPATLGHQKDLRFMDSGIKPVYRRCRVVGPALTVRAPGGVDAGVLNEVTDLCRPGDVIVVDRCGDTEHACFGEFRALKHLELGMEGWVIDGATCDAVAIEDMQFPTFSRTVSALVAKLVGLQGEVNTPVICGGVVVNPGDLVIGDDDGVVVLSPAEAEELISTCLEKEEKEVEMRKRYAPLLEKRIKRHA
jgi:4-hydroxy-4-methyl-2-oxoglutarate aldolase